MSITMAPVEETLHRALNYKAEGLYDEATWARIGATTV